MKVALLYSGGKDSSLAAYLLDLMGFDVLLLTATFGINNDWMHARTSARALGFEHKLLQLDQNILQETIEVVKKDGFPKNAFLHIHKNALETAAKTYKALSDGTRRDDKTPVLTMQDIRRLEDVYGIMYNPVLRGLSHKAIKKMCAELFLIEEGDGSKINKGDYEGELRTFLKNHGVNVENIFPRHTQTRVISWRDNHVKGFKRKKDKASKGHKTE